VIEGWTIPKVPPHPEIRARLESEIDRDGLEPLTARLREVDPIVAERSGQNPRRVIRALEIFEVTGRPMSELEGKGERPYDAFEIELTMPRDRLYQEIDDRVERQIAAGLVEEVRALLSAGLSPAASSMSSLGYRQLVPYLEGRESLDEAKQQIKLDTHNFVRKQATWFRKNPRAIRIDVTEPGWQAKSADLVRQFLREPGHRRQDV
jgi:tRNA dimethylallyltransferase